MSRTRPDAHAHAHAHAHAQPADAALKILIADDHHLVREGLKLAIREIDPAATIIEAETLSATIATHRAGRDFDLVLLDLNMSDAGGTALLDEFERQCPDARFVVISAAYDLDTVRDAIRRGALGFIPKLTGKAVLMGALRFVLEGGRYVPPEILVGVPEVSAAASPVARTAATATAAAGPQASPHDAGLTARQCEVLRELMLGKSNKQICRDLNLAMGTVKGHIAAVLTALGVSSRAEAIAEAARRGWLDRSALSA